MSLIEFDTWYDHVMLMVANVQGLLLCWYFIMSSPEPIEKLKMKITTKADRIPSAGYGLIEI